MPSMETVTLEILGDEVPYVIKRLRGSSRHEVRAVGIQLAEQFADQLPLRCPVTFPSTECGDFSTGTDGIAPNLTPADALAGHLVEIHGLPSNYADYKAAKAVKRWGGVSTPMPVD